jgi:hypothetical protein
VKTVERITLPKTSVLYVSLFVLVVILVIVLLSFQPTLQNAWCRQFEIPEYEKTFGFRLGAIALPDGTGATREATGVAWVDPVGAFARAGVRTGDIPHMHHGMQDLCWTLSRAAKGYTVQLEVVNVADVREGQSGRRRVVLGLAHP